MGSPVAHVANPEAMNQSPQRPVLAGLHSLPQFGGTLLTEPLKLPDRFPIEPINVTGILDPAEVDEPIGKTGAESLDIHRRPTDVMVHPFLQLSGAGGIGAIAHGDPWLTMHRCAAGGAGVGHGERDFGASPSFFNDFDDLRNHVSRPLHHDGVADPNVLAGDFVFIVQGCT